MGEESIAQNDTGIEGGEQTEEVVDASTGQSDASDDSWSINNVPEEYRSHVEAAIKPFHGQATKAAQESAQYRKQVEELSGKVSEYEQTKLHRDRLEEFSRRLLEDDGFRDHERARYGIKRPDPTAKPEGWDSPEAVQARNLLIEETERMLEQKYGIRMADLPKIIQQTSQVANITQQKAIEDSQNEIDQTKAIIEKDGMPWNEDILNASIAVVAQYSKQGKKLGLREAYDKLMTPAIERYKANEASTDETLKTGTKPMKPGDRGGKVKLTGDALLKDFLDKQGIPGNYDD